MAGTRLRPLPLGTDRGAVTIAGTMAVSTEPLDCAGHHVGDGILPTPARDRSSACESLDPLQDGAMRVLVSASALPSRSSATVAIGTSSPVGDWQAPGSSKHDQPGMVTVPVYLGSSRVPVSITREDILEAGRYPSTGASTVRRAISKGVRDALGFDSRWPLLLRLDYLLQGLPIHEELVPEDFEQLRFLVARGGACRTGCRRPGGMDPDARRQFGPDNPARA